MVLWPMSKKEIFHSRPFSSIEVMIVFHSLYFSHFLQSSFQQLAQEGPWSDLIDFGGLCIVVETGLSRIKAKKVIGIHEVDSSPHN